MIYGHDNEQDNTMLDQVKETKLVRLAERPAGTQRCRSRVVAVDGRLQPANFYKLRRLEKCRSAKNAARNDKHTKNTHAT